MIDKIKSAIEELEFDMEIGEFYNPSMADSVKLAIRSLKAWEEVLNELENIRNHPRANLNQYFIDGINVATEIINQKLAEIEE